MTDTTALFPVGSTARISCGYDEYDRPVWERVTVLAEDVWNNVLPDNPHMVILFQTARCGTDHGVMTVPMHQLATVTI
jgi:hypothetical protein